MDGDLEGISTRNILLLHLPKTLEPMTVALQSLQDKLEQSYEEDDGPMEVRIEDRLVNEYTSNNRLLAGAFPHIFPFGLPSEKFSGPIPKKVVRTWFYTTIGVVHVRFVYCGSYLTRRCVMLPI